LTNRENYLMRKPICSSIAALLLAFYTLCGCTAREVPRHSEKQGAGDLADHSGEFRQELIKVTDGIYVAVGFGLANSVLLEGTDGLVIVDTMESAEAAAKVKREFQKVSSKPVKAIIYTHFHSDHTQGATVMAGGDCPEIYCHALTLEQLSRIAGITRETTYRRAMRQFGSLLPEGYLINAGIGPYLDFDDNKTIAFLPPTKTFASERMDVDICGIRITLIHAPGETPDQTVVWIAEKKVLLPADNFYRAFPNLYAIRGTA
jgi:alkyl sulfatase BDS1-like metallo-beta-lactamase superfamily hydrolase